MLSKARTFLLAAAIAMVASCSDGDGDSLTHKSVRSAAEGYYSLLAEGRYAEFVSGRADASSLPASYHSELTDMVAQYVAEQTGGGLVCAVATADSIWPDSTALVFLDLQFADSTREQVCLPMVLRDKRWLMR